ncbi:FHA domain-containing protein [Nocardia sp. alder85J]|uniref:FHA domain-containing protein n=1 Tax=Nocardia sp. alder85J TaxID=2862949 RepID=UPI001CD2AD86|nr:FHA domain-containing protein [Nocardia sp. alder85J]MCX4094968.1 FHA domain-containing protein [Nocardia sp. alder85J]
MTDMDSLLAELPASVRDVVLGHWPATQVEPMRRCSAAHAEMCQALNAAADRYDAASAQAEAAVDGDIGSGLETRHRAVAQAMRNQAAVHEGLAQQFSDTADATLSTQHLLIVGGIVLAAQLSFDMLMFFQGGGFKALGDRLEAEAAMRATAERFAVDVGDGVARGAARRVALHGALHAAKIGAIFGAVTSAGAQIWDLADGNRTRFDLGAFLEQAAGGALGGVAGAEVGRRLAPRLLGTVAGRTMSRFGTVASYIGRVVLIGGAGGAAGGIAGALPSLALHPGDIHSLGDVFAAVRDSAITGFGGGVLGAASGALRPHGSVGDVAPVVARNEEFGVRLRDLLGTEPSPRVERITADDTAGETPATVERLTFADGTRVVHIAADDPRQAERALTAVGAGSGAEAPAVHMIGNHFFVEESRPDTAVRRAGATEPAGNRRSAESLTQPGETGREKTNERVFASSRDRGPRPLEEVLRPTGPGRPGSEQPVGDVVTGSPAGHPPAAPRLPERVGVSGDRSGEPVRVPEVPGELTPGLAPGESSVGVVTAQYGEEPHGAEEGEPPPPEPDPFDESVDQFTMRHLMSGGGGGDLPPPRPWGGDWEDRDPPSELDQDLAAHAFARLPGGGDIAPADLLLPLDRSAYVDGGVTPEEFAEHGRRQAVNNLTWWRGLTDDSIPADMLARVSQEPFGQSGFGLSRLQRALLRSHPELLTRALGIPDDVSSQASLRVLTERLRVLDSKAASGARFTSAEVMEHYRAPQLLASMVQDIGVSSAYVRDFDPASGEATFIFGDAATATKRVYVVASAHPNMFAADYHESWLTAKRLYLEMQRMQPDADVAVVAWVRSSGDDVESDALRGPLLRRDIAAGNSVYLANQHVDPTFAALGIDVEVVGSHDVITLGHASATGYAGLGEEGLATLFAIDPHPSHGPETPPADAQLYTSYTRGEDPRQGPALHGGQHLAAVDGTRHPADPKAGESSSMLRVMARIGLGQDVSRYVPELSDSSANLAPDGANLPTGNQALRDLGADDVFPLRDGAQEWQALEGSIRGRLVPVDDLAPDGAAVMDRLADDLRAGVARTDNGVVVPGAVADTYTVVLDNGEAAYRLELTRVGEGIVVIDPLVGGPLELGRWQELRLHPTIDSAWVIAHGLGEDGVLRPIEANLHDPTVARSDMPSRAIGAQGVDAPYAERVPGRLTFAFLGEEDGYVKAVTTGGEVAIGRRISGAAMFRHYETVSRDHARVGVLRDGRVWIADNGSRLGTFVNEERLGPGEVRVIGPTDSIRLGLNFHTSIGFQPDRPLPDTPSQPSVSGEPPAPRAPGESQLPQPSGSPRAIGFGAGSEMIPLGAGEKIEIGRNFDLRLPEALRGDIGVSRHHAEIGFDDRNRAGIRDLGSTNGTYVNGKRIGSSKPTPLADGDRIRVGNYETTIHLPARAAEAVDSPPPVTIRSAGADGGSLQLTPGSVVVLGRGDGPLMPQLEHLIEVSRFHATIWMDENDQVWIRDDGSTNGTFVNGEQIDPNTPVPLEGEVEIALGSSYRLVANFGEPRAPRR